MGSGPATSTTATTFASDVLASPIPVLVDFWAPWCGPCRMLSPILDDIAADRSETLTVAKVNIDENPDLAETYGVMSVPTLMVFSQGRPVRTVVGSKPKAALLRELADFL